MADATHGGGGIPYGSYRVLRNFLDGLREGVPHRIDRTVLTTYSGTSQRYLLRTLPQLGLTDEFGNTTQTLNELVSADNGDRQELWRAILERTYPELLANQAFNLSTATDAMLKKRLEEAYGISGDTVNKARAFFLHAAQDAGLEISRFIKVSASPKRGRSKGNAGRGRGRAATGGAQTNGTVAPEPVATPPSASVPGAPGSGQWYHQAVGMLQFLPANRRWTSAERDAWFRMFEAALDYLIEVTDDGVAEQPSS